MLASCPQCHLPNTLATATCRSCGFDLTGGAAVLPARTTVTPQRIAFPGHTLAPAAGRAAAAAVGTGNASWWANLLGWKTIEGRVINIDPMYMAQADFSWANLSLKLLVIATLVLILSPILIGLALGALVLMLMLSFLFPRSGDRYPGLISSTFSQATGFLFSRKLSKAPADIPVRDARLRDMAGVERLVRLKGHVIAGNINVGDEIVVTGVDRGGTLLFRSGWNKRINSEIKVKPR
jgi:hypothetical protein